MRVREWYSWHFPELQKVVNDNVSSTHAHKEREGAHNALVLRAHETRAESCEPGCRPNLMIAFPSCPSAPLQYLFAKLAVFIKNKADLTADKLPQLEEIIGDSVKAQQVLDASRMSMGTDISPIDMINIESFATRVVSLTEYRKKLHNYLLEKMNLSVSDMRERHEAHCCKVRQLLMCTLSPCCCSCLRCAPNLSALIGEQVGARLISHAGSLTNLAKYPASTVQILGAEKALFRSVRCCDAHTLLSLPLVPISSF